MAIASQLCVLLAEAGVLISACFTVAALRGRAGLKEG